MATAPADAPAKEKVEPRPETVFRVFVRPEDAEEWTLYPQTVIGRTQDEGKKRAARLLGDDAQYGPLIQGAGISLAVVSARSFKPVLVKVEPQPSKVVIR